MQLLSALLLSLLASLVSSVQVPGLPKCAGNCVNGLGGCQLLQYNCICSNKPLLTELACCVSKNCDAADQAKAIKFAKSICAAQGHVSDLPSTATCAPGAASSASSASSASVKSTDTSSGAANALETGLGLLMAGLAVAL